MTYFGSNMETLSKHYEIWDRIRSLQQDTSSFAQSSRSAKEGCHHNQKTSIFKGFVDKPWVRLEQLVTIGKPLTP